MGQKTLGTIMKVMAEKAGLTDKKISNHSVRRTMCTTLLQEGVAPNIIAQLSGHKNIASLQHYSVASTSQQKDMSNLLQHIKTPTPTPSCTITKPKSPPHDTTTPTTPTSDTITCTPHTIQNTSPITPQTPTFTYTTPQTPTFTYTTPQPTPFPQFLEQSNLTGASVKLNVYYGKDKK